VANSFAAVVLAVCAALAAAPAMAHDFWIQPDRFLVSAGDIVQPALLVGHGEERQRSPLPARRVLRYEAVAPDGSSIDLRGGPAQLAGEGVHVLVLETDDQAQSHQPAARFNAYLYAEGLTAVIEHRERYRRAGEPGAERYRRVAKALVVAGSPTAGGHDEAMRAFGLPLEIVLERVPDAARGADAGSRVVAALPPEVLEARVAAASQAEALAGRALAARVLYRGRALEGALVRLTDLADDEEPLASERTDKEGRAKFAMPQGCGSWLLSVVWSEPSQRGDGIDYETIFSSLSFARGANCQASAKTVTKPMEDNTSHGSAGILSERARSIR